MARVCHKFSNQLPQRRVTNAKRPSEQRRARDHNLYFLDGLKLINDSLYLLVIDQIHPNEGGSLKMAEGIAATLKPILAGLNIETTRAPNR